MNKSNLAFKHAMAICKIHKDTDEQRSKDANQANGHRSITTK